MLVGMIGGLILGGDERGGNGSGGGEVAGCGSGGDEVWIVIEVTIKILY